MQAVNITLGASGLSVENSGAHVPRALLLGNLLLCVSGKRLSVLN